MRDGSQPPIGPAPGSPGQRSAMKFAAPLPIVAAPRRSPAAACADWSGGRGLLVVGHGTADSVGAAETREIADRVAELLGNVPVELGFLEVIGPTIDEALERLARRGCHEIVAAPLLLFTAGHARRDVPEAIASAAARRGLEVRQSAAFGCHPQIVAISRQRRCETLHALVPLAPEETVLLMVGRGSSDPAAAGQLAEFAQATIEPGPHAVGRDISCGRTIFGFVAAARPTVPEAIEIASGFENIRRVIVQPHLLFRGHVEEQVEACLRGAREAHPQIEWVQVRRLGPDPLVAAALVDRATAVVWNGIRDGFSEPKTISPDGARDGTMQRCERSPERFP